MVTTQASIRQKKSYRLAIIIFLAGLSILSTIACVATGSVSYTFKEVIDALFTEDATARLIVWHVRLPRILCGGLVGVCLSLAGCILQGVMRNHLASPSTIGVTSGASFVGYIMRVAYTNYGLY